MQFVLFYLTLKINFELSVARNWKISLRFFDCEKKLHGCFFLRARKVDRFGGQFLFTLLQYQITNFSKDFCSFIFVYRKICWRFFEQLCISVYHMRGWWFLSKICFQVFRIIHVPNNCKYKIQKQHFYLFCNRIITINFLCCGNGFVQIFSSFLQVQL